MLLNIKDILVVVICIQIPASGISNCMHHPASSYVSGREYQHEESTKEGSWKLTLLLTLQLSWSCTQCKKLVVMHFPSGPPRKGSRRAYVYIWKDGSPFFEVKDGSPCV